MNDFRASMEQKRKEMLGALLESIESNPSRWERGWVSISVPYNAVSGKNYTGVNALFLAFVADKKNFSDTRWVTFNQAKDLGASIKKGEKGSEIFYFSVYDKATKKPYDPAVIKYLSEEEQKKYLEENVRNVLKTYTVFNAEQCSDFPKNTRITGMSDAERLVQNERIEYIIKNSAAPIFYDGGNEAYYLVSKDDIHLPELQSFLTKQDFYATALHEIGHSTGHPTRLNRNLSGGFGSESYALEELRAELASVFIQAELGIDLGDAKIANHGAYLKSWLNAVKNDYKLFYQATSDAGKIADYIKAEYELASTNKKAQNKAVNFTFVQNGADYNIKHQSLGWELSTAELPQDVRNSVVWLIQNGYQNEKDVQSALYNRLTSSMADDIETAVKDDNAKLKKLYVKYSELKTQEETIEVATSSNAPLGATEIVSTDNSPVGISTWVSKRREERFSNLEKNIPQQMKEMPNWACFWTRTNPEKGNKEKHIMTAVDELVEKKRAEQISKGLKPTGLTWARVDDPATWTTFDKALKFAKEQGCDGLSFALTKDSGLFCIDLDKCKIDGKYSPLAWSVYNEAKRTYVERSVSGNGLHLFGKKGADVDFSALGNKNSEGTLEFYDDRRFISMTGDLFMKSDRALKTFSKTDKLITATQGSLPAKSQVRRTVTPYINNQSDEQVIERIKRSQKADDFKRLFLGDNMCGDFSKSDMKLMNILAFFTNGDAEQMKRIFKGSGLHRPSKSDRYYDLTANKAIESLITLPTNIKNNNIAKPKINKPFNGLD